MRMETIAKLCCPFDKEELDLTILSQDLSGNVLEGILHCKTCKRIYPIIKGIPIMSPDEYREKKYEQPMLDAFAERGKLLVRSK
ncbi:hypothetical protein P872_11720 [Rhodonellum psychrophilum GCM71 = DSM 17998]|uniref:Trm112p-like protein n=3 Tax=Cytophagaceae TaxID=89373 RepID=U5BSV4_9BACT|nr:hypothetical protein P872_11720 [Rhodonellum psychrophilum GCM71 = DSM 17998]SDZ55443.1 Uncharacterized conserved protein YbaR, Trm112 family [Rhodonellum ikkaensis]